jgi:hypothetical protein
MPRVDLEDAVQRLYSAFAGYHVPRVVPGCPCCHTPEELTRITSKPLRDLAWDDLERYASDALLTWGDVDHFKHFLPRIFDLLVLRGALDWPGPEIVFAKLHYVGWRSWLPEEQQAIEEYLWTGWHQMLGENLSESEAWLCGVARAVDDLQEFLDAWRAHPSPVAALNLAAIVNPHIARIARKRRPPNVFWSEARVQAGQFLNWMVEPDTVAWVEGVFFTAALEDLDTPFGVPADDELATLVDNLSWLRDIWSSRDVS